MDKIILTNTNPFDEDNDFVIDISNFVIDIRVFQRSPRRYVTTIEGLNQININLKKVVKYMKKIFSCGATIIKDKHNNDVIKLQGDQRNGIKDFLLDENIVTTEQIKVHGY